MRNAIALIVVLTLLCWGSDPVPDEHGMVVCDVYEFPFTYQGDDKITIADSIERHHIETVVDDAAIIKAVWNEQKEAMYSAFRAMPWLNSLLPSRFRHHVFGGWVLRVRMKQDEYYRLKERRRQGLPLAYLYSR